MTGPRVSFYVLPGSDERQRQVLACRLAEKAWLQQDRVLLTVDTADEATALDELLWRFAELSFVPHAVAGSPGADAAPVLIGVASTAPGAARVLVNLSRELPGQPEHFERIAELVDADDERRRLGRERFRAYRERGIMPDTHTLGAA